MWCCLWCCFWLVLFVLSVGHFAPFLVLAQTRSGASMEHGRASRRHPQPSPENMPRRHPQIHCRKTSPNDRKDIPTRHPAETPSKTPPQGHPPSTSLQSKIHLEDIPEHITQENRKDVPKQSPQYAFQRQTRRHPRRTSPKTSDQREHPRQPRRHRQRTVQRYPQTTTAKSETVFKDIPLKTHKRTFLLKTSLPRNLHSGSKVLRLPCHLR